jgi:hypothetical protein
MVYLDCLQRLQSCENNAAAKKGYGNQQAFLKEVSIIFSSKFSGSKILFIFLQTASSEVESEASKGVLFFKFLMRVYSFSPFTP